MLVPRCGMEYVPNEAVVCSVPYVVCSYAPWTGLQPSIAYSVAKTMHQTTGRRTAVYRGDLANASQPLRHWHYSSCSCWSSRALMDNVGPGEVANSRVIAADHYNTVAVNGSCGRKRTLSGSSFSRRRRVSPPRTTKKGSRKGDEPFGLRHRSVARP